MNCWTVFLNDWKKTTEKLQKKRQHLQDTGFKKIKKTNKCNSENNNERDLKSEIFIKC